MIVATKHDVLSLKPTRFEPQANQDLRWTLSGTFRGRREWLLVLNG